MSTTAFFGSKGGAGTTVVAAVSALLAARLGDGALIVDLAGDVPSVLGLPNPDGPGVVELLAEFDRHGCDGDGRSGSLMLSRCFVEGPGGLRILHLGGNSRTDLAGRSTASAAILAGLLAGQDRPVIIDAGTRPTGAALALAAGASAAVLVTRLCYIAMARASTFPLRASGVVVIAEPGRAMSSIDLGAVLGLSVIAEVPFMPDIAQAVDAGTLGFRVPRSIERPLRTARSTVKA